jgi:hypothetical protein
MAMSEDAPKRTLIGVIPTGTDVHLFGEDIAAAARMLDDANRRADLARAEEERKRLSAIADAARVQNTRRARVARRFRRALTAFTRLK